MSAYKLPLPDSEGTYEDMVTEALRKRHSNPHLIRYGRRGQGQHGIDGWDPQSDSLVWQTTLISDSGKIVTKFDKDIAEMDKKFEPKLYIFVCGSKRDTDIQDAVSAKSTDRICVGKCPAEILFWDDIADIIDNDKELRQRFYPHYMRDSTLDAASIAVYRTRAKSLFSPRKGIGSSSQAFYVPIRVWESGSKTPANHLADVLKTGNAGQGARLRVIGNVGSGKSTWIRHLAHEAADGAEVLPVLIESHHIIPRGSESVGPAIKTLLTVEAWIERALTDAAPNAHVLTRTIESETKADRLLLLLLIDGLDELGEYADLATKSIDAFLSIYPQVHVVATSRPHLLADSGWRGYEVQALSTAEVRAFALARFSNEEETDRFCNYVSTPRFRDMTHNPMLLCMLMDEGDDLVDGFVRCKLYENLIDRLVERLPDSRKHASVAWRPEDLDDRRSPLEQIALLLHDGESVQQSISRKEFIARLPKTWAANNRDGFVDWCIQTSGILVERAPAQYGFVHRSIQEFLAAKALLAKGQSPDIILASIHGKCLIPEQWEMLCFYLDLLSLHSDVSISELVNLLIDGTAAQFWFAGKALSRGDCASDCIEKWFVSLPERAARSYSSRLTLACASGWKESPDVAQAHMAKLGLTEIENWAQWLRFKEFVRALGIDYANLPCADVQVVTKTLDNAAQNAADVAWGRCMIGAYPLWDCGHTELLLLRLWPSRRFREGIGVQLFHSISPRGLPHEYYVAGHHEREDLSSIVVDEQRLLDFARMVANDGMIACGPESGRVLRHGVQDAGRHVLAQDGNIDPWMFATALTMSVNDGFSELPERARPAPFRFGKFQRGWMSAPYALDIIGNSDSAECDWDLVQAVSHGAFLTRVALAYFLPVPSADDAFMRSPLLATAREACRVSLNHDSANRATLLRFLALLGDEPLWPALFRHIARMSTQEDRSLLSSLAEHPERREGVLRWGLQHWIRGDIVNLDGTTETLDDVRRRAGMGPLPFLDEMLKEITLPHDEVEGYLDAALSRR